MDEIGKEVTRQLYDTTAAGRDGRIRITVVPEMTVRYRVFCPTFGCRGQQTLAAIVQGQRIECERCGRIGTVQVQTSEYMERRMMPPFIFVEWAPQEDPHRCTRCGKINAKAGNDMCDECGLKSVAYGGGR